MRRPRIKLLHQPACYHIVCRITQGQLWLGTAEKASLCQLLDRVSCYCGVEVLTYTVMSNHFHLLVRIPEKALADARLDGLELSRRVRALYGEDSAKGIYSLWEGRSLGTIKPLWVAELATHQGRMHDLSIFMQMLKQRFTMAHNRDHGTRGTLWTERFKSVLVESRVGSSPNPVLIVAAYIDLNSVRAGINSKATDYPFSGIGRAYEGDKASQQGIMALTNEITWGQAKLAYERLLGGVGPEPLLSRQVSLIKGVVLGSAKFVLEVLIACAEIKRRARPQAYASGGFGDLWVGNRFRGD